MKENEFLDGVSNIDPDIVERFVSMDKRLQKKPSIKPIWARVGAAAASLLIVTSIVLSVISNIVPTWNTAHYSASDIAKLFSATKDGATNAYTKVYVSEEEYLYIDEVPNSKYLPIYRYPANEKSLSKKELKKFAGGFLSRLSKSLNTDIPDYKIKSRRDSKELYADADMGEYNIDLSQDKTRNAFWFSNYYDDDNNCEIVLDGETVQIDQRLSDGEILKSLESIKNKLFDIFGVSFKDAKIIRDFDGNSSHGAEWVWICFYNEDAHPINEYVEQPVSDCIKIRFDNFENSSNDIVSDSILTKACIYYFKNRVAAYDHIANAKRISLEKAEELLYKGYVFGGHSCPLCMAAQDKISFKGYDFVDLEYVYDAYSDEPTAVIPFYAFYKKLNTNKNGTVTYAKTYVPAIQVSGYEEYFENQAANHR